MKLKADTVKQLENMADKLKLRRLGADATGARKASFSVDELDFMHMTVSQVLLAALEDKT